MEVEAAAMEAEAAVVEVLVEVEVATVAEGGAVEVDAAAMTECSGGSNNGGMCKQLWLNISLWPKLLKITVDPPIGF